MPSFDARLIDDSGELFGASANPIYITNSNIDMLALDAHHETKIFPTLVTQSVTFTAGATNATFGAWTEIADSGSNKFTDCFTSDGYFVSFIIEDASVSDKVYLIEFAYGDTKTVIGRSRVLSGSTKKDTTNQPRMGQLKIPAGQTVYYRMACETGGATLTGHLRYYLT